MVLRYCLPTDAFCTLGHVVDHGCDTPIDSFVVHSPSVEQVERGCKGRQAMFLIFLSNVSYARDDNLVKSDSKKCQQAFLAPLPRRGTWLRKLTK